LTARPGCRVLQLAANQQGGINRRNPLRLGKILSKQPGPPLYSPGTDPVLDEAIGLHSRIEQFLQQGIEERANIKASLEQLLALFA